MSQSLSSPRPADVGTPTRSLLERLRSFRRRSQPDSRGPASVLARLGESPRIAAQLSEPARGGPSSNGDHARFLAPEATHVPAGATGEDELTTSEAIEFGSQVLVFAPEQKDSTIQSRIDDVYREQVKSHFGSNRWAFLFKPGEYNLDIKLGFYTTCHGLGARPSDVVITGSVRIKGDYLPDKNSTLNFWRGVENLTIIPTLTEDKRKVVWAVSQGTFFRRIHVKGDMILSDRGGWSSGGYSESRNGNTDTFLRAGCSHD